MTRNTAATILEREEEIRTKPLIAQTEAPTYDEIARLAYQHWEEGGCRPDTAFGDWLAAEHSLRSKDRELEGSGSAD